MQRDGWNGLIVGLNVGALTFLLLERMIGETIFANVILIGLSIILLLTAAGLGLVDLIKRRNMQSCVTFSVSALLGLYIAARLYYESVPVGYGP